MDSNKGTDGKDDVDNKNESLHSERNTDTAKDGNPTVPIPVFEKGSKRLTEEERHVIAKKRGLCPYCGVRTHVKINFRDLIPLTNDDANGGICRRCPNPN